MTADLESGYKLDFADGKKLIFEGKSKLDKNKTYKLDLDLYAEVETDADKRKEALNGKDLSLVLTKKGALNSWCIRLVLIICLLGRTVLGEEYWPRLSKDKKVAFIKTDFSKVSTEDPNLVSS